MYEKILLSFTVRDICSDIPIIKYSPRAEGLWENFNELLKILYVFFNLLKRKRMWQVILHKAANPEHSSKKISPWLQLGFGLVKGNVQRINLLKNIKTWKARLKDKSLLWDVTAMLVKITEKFLKRKVYRFDVPLIIKSEFLGR